MTRTSLGLIFLIISAISIQLYLVGNQGNLVIRTRTIEDLLIIGAIAFSCLAGIYLLIGKPRKIKLLF